MTNNLDLKELSELLDAKLNEVKYNRIVSLFPDDGAFSRDKYPKHIEFMAAGAKYNQRAFVAGNRTGKTVAGAFEMACHLTGIYPKWWKGKKFLNAISAWAVGVSNQQVKAVLQRELLGNGSSLEDEGLGTGLIPKAKITKITKKPGVPDAVDTIQVRHVSGALSDLSFLAYEQGREIFQGTKKQVIWLDEEPKDIGIYSECLTRLADPYNPGIIFCTFTPLFGLSDVVQSFLPDGRFPEGGVHEKSPHKFVTQVTWDEVPHLTEQQKEEMYASYSPHERDARRKGIPSLGAGAIYPYSEDFVVVEPFQIPDWWARCYGMDVGWNKTAAIWLAVDPDSNQVFAYSEHYQGFEQPVVHALAIKARGDWITGAIDPKSNDSSQADGKALFDLYEEQGLLLEKANNSVEAGILRVGQMFASGQLKIMSNLKNLLSEFRVYRRDEHGKVVKKNDHALDALRYAVVSGLDYADVRPDKDARSGGKFPPIGNRDRYTGY